MRIFGSYPLTCCPSLVSKNPTSCVLASGAQIDENCLEASQFQPLKISRFTNPIFNDIGLIVPINKGKESSIYTAKNSHLLKHNMLFNKLVALNEKREYLFPITR
jgi:hypothetical protein